MVGSLYQRYTVHQRAFFVFQLIFPPHPSPNLIQPPSPPSPFPPFVTQLFPFFPLFSTPQPSTPLYTMSTSSLRRSNSSKKGNGKEKKVKKTKLSSSVKTNGSSKADSLKELRREESLRSQTTDDQTPPPPPPIGRGTVEPASTFMLPGLGVEDSDTFDSPSRQMSVSFFDRYASKVIDTKHSDKKDSDAVREVATTLLHATSISGLSSELVTLRRNVKEAETAVDTKSKRCDALLEEMEDTYRGYERDTLVSLCNSEELNRETIRWAFSHGVALLAQSMSIAEPQVSGHHAVEINELVHNEWTDRNDIEKLSFKKFSAICESCPLIKDLKDMAEDHLLASHVADINCKLSFAETELVMSETSVRKLQGQLKQMQKDLAKKDELLRDYQTKAPYLNIAQNASGVDVSMSEGNSVGHSLSDAHEEEREKEKEYNVADREWSRSQQPGDVWTNPFFFFFFFFFSFFSGSPLGFPILKMFC